jgi:hypothetical protein
MDQQKSFNNNKLDLNTRHRALGENTAVEPIFARQCVFLCYPADYHPWLTAEDATALLKPAHNQVLYVYEAGPQIGAVTKKDPDGMNVPNKDPSLIEPIEHYGDLVSQLPSRLPGGDIKLYRHRRNRSLRGGYAALCVGESYK